MGIPAAVSAATGGASASGIGAVAKNAAIAGSGSGLFGTMFGWIGAKRRANRAQKHNIELWNMQNAYNHPSRQMARLREAGLNPNLIYGSSPSGASGSAGAIAPYREDKPDIQTRNPIQQLGLTAQIRNTKAQTDNLREQQILIGQDVLHRQAQTASELEKGNLTRTQAEIAKEMKQTSMDILRMDLRQREASTIGQELSNFVKDHTKWNDIMDVYYRVQLAKETLTGKDLSNQISQADLNLKSIGLQPSDPIYWRIMGQAVGGSDGLIKLWEKNKNRFKNMGEAYLNIAPHLK